MFGLEVSREIRAIAHKLSNTCSLVGDQHPLNSMKIFADSDVDLTREVEGFLTNRIAPVTIINEQKRPFRLDVCKRKQIAFRCRQLHLADIDWISE